MLIRSMYTTLTRQTKWTRSSGVLGLSYEGKLRRMLRVSDLIKPGSALLTRRGPTLHLFSWRSAGFVSSRTRLSRDPDWRAPDSEDTSLVVKGSGIWNPSQLFSWILCFIEMWKQKIAAPVLRANNHRALFRDMAWAARTVDGEADVPDLFECPAPVVPARASRHASLTLGRYRSPAA